MVNETMYNKYVAGLNVLVGIDYLNLKYFNLSSNIGFIQKGGKDSILIVTQFGEPENKELFKITVNYITINTTANV